MIGHKLREKGRLPLAPVYYRGECYWCEGVQGILPDWDGKRGGWKLTCGHRVSLWRWEGERRWGRRKLGEISGEWLGWLKWEQNRDQHVRWDFEFIPKLMWDLALKVGECEEPWDLTDEGSGWDLMLELLRESGRGNWLGSMGAREDRNGGVTTRILRIYRELRWELAWRLRSTVEEGKWSFATASKRERERALERVERWL